MISERDQPTVRRAGLVVIGGRKGCGLLAQENLHASFFTLSITAAMLDPESLFLAVPNR